MVYPKYLTVYFADLSVTQTCLLWTKEKLSIVSPKYSMFQKDVFHLWKDSFVNMNRMYTKLLKNKLLFGNVFGNF